MEGFMTQTDQILAYMKRGNPINPMGALRLFKSFRLAARIKELKGWGYRIERQMRTSRDGSRYAEYTLK
jgi:hypothetical protein